MFYVYALKSLKRNYIYVGQTNNLTRRVDEHNSGKNKTTRPYLPFKLVYKTAYSTRVEARQKEKLLKNGAGKEFLKTLK